MTKLHTPLALALCAVLAACGGGSGSTDDVAAKSQLNSGNARVAIALSQRAQDSALVVNNLYKLASIEVLKDLPDTTAGACSGGGDFSYAATAQQESLQLRQCQLANYRYRKGTLTYAGTAAGSALTLADVGFDMPLLGMSFDVSGTVAESVGAGQQMAWTGDIRIASGAHSDSWKYTLQAPPAGSDANDVSGELSLQTSRLQFPLSVRWMAGNPSLVIQAPDGSSVTVSAARATQGTAQLRSATGAVSPLSFTSAELSAAKGGWSY